MSDDSNTERNRLQLEAWKQSIAVTMHFTDMSVKARQLGFAFAVGALALAVAMFVQYKEALFKLRVGDMEYGAHISALIMLCAAVALLATWYLDIRVYHQMLRGSVQFTQAIEAGPLFSEVLKTPQGLATSISHSSRRSGWIGRLAGRKATKAQHKLAIFYLCSVLAILGLSSVITFATWHEAKFYPRILQKLE